MFSLYSNSDLRNLSVFASPVLARRRRNVYSEPNQYWMLRESEVKEEDPSVVSKISQLQQRVEIAQSTERSHLMFSLVGQCLQSSQ